MGMEMRLGLGLYQDQRQELNIEQEQALKQLLELSQKLRHESFPEAVRGIEGLLVADRILKEKNLGGVLIGGLAEAVFNEKHTKKDFDKHKDVDVLVIETQKESGIGDLEGGIDWWFAKEADLKINYESGTTDMNVKYWENAFGIKLAFGVSTPYIDRLPVGLYIPSYDFVLKMRKVEALSQLDPKIAVNTDEDIEDSFEERLEQRITDEKSPIIEEMFEGQGRQLCSVESFDYETIIAINGINSQK